MTVGKSLRNSVQRIALGALAPVTALAVLGAVNVADAAYAATGTQALQFAPTDDTYTSSARPNFTAGSVDKLATGRLSGDTMQAYLKFTVGTLPAGGTVSRATLTLTRDEHHLPASVVVSSVATGWKAATVTSKTAPALGTTLDTEHPTGTAAQVTFDVTAAVKGPGTYGFAVTAPITADVARFRSNEYATGHPVLTVTVSTPVADKPATPATPATSTKPAIPATPTPTGPCRLDAKLVPTCHILWGAAAGGFTTTPRDEALTTWERKSGRTATVYHMYHSGDQQFPTRSEIAMTQDPTKPRILFLNWKVSDGVTWAKVAAGGEDRRIDTEAAYLKTHFTQRFFLTLHHEPENDVNPAAGSGMTAKDFAAMFRHTVQRLRADGVTNAVSVMTYMSYEKWFNSSWWGDLYPGDSVVDWIALDSYLMAKPGFHHGPFSDALDRTTSTKFPGFYKWATTVHANKPFMLGEWGVYEYTADPSQKVGIFNTVLTDLARYPAIKAMFYFDSPSTQAGYDSRIDSSAGALAAFQRIAADPRFNVLI